MRVVAAAGVALLALLAFAQTPGGRAQARPPAPSSAAFTVAASNGFTIDVGSERGLVTLVASERRPPIASFSPAGRPRPADNGNGASNLYYARGAGDSPTQVSTHLGGLGAIAVSFQPSGKTKVTVMQRGEGGCSRPVRIVRRLGTFTGTIRFHGEDGYTEVEATRAPGSVGTPLPAGCGDGGEAGARAASQLAAPGPAPGSAVLSAGNRRAGTTFEARTTETGVAFRATREERLDGGLVVVRRAYAGAPPSTFAFNSKLSWARVKPPAPFSGVARFDAGAARAERWKGNLRATFPGVNEPLAGRPFKVSLEAGR